MEVRMIAGHELTPGKTVKDHIHVEGTELHVPHVLLCGRQPGPTVLITAGIHNAEYVGIQAAIELSNELDVDALHGSVIIVPLANRSGFENRTMSRVFEDGKNLNRVFPGDREGSEADRLAHMLFEVFIKNADAYIDLHSGDGFETLVPFCYYLGDTPAEETAKGMIDCVSTKYCVRSRCRTPRSACSSARRTWICTSCATERPKTTRKTANVDRIRRRDSRAWSSRRQRPMLSAPG